MQARSSRHGEHLQRLALRRAIDLDLASGLTATVLSKASGLSVAAASDTLTEYVEAGMLERSVISRVRDQYAYFITEAGQQWLQANAKEKPTSSVRLDFGPLLTFWGHWPKAQL